MADQDSAFALLQADMESKNSGELDLENRDFESLFRQREMFASLGYPTSKLDAELNRLAAARKSDADLSEGHASVTTRSVFL